MYTTFNGVNVYRDKLGSRSPTVHPGQFRTQSPVELEILTLDTRELSEVVHNDLARMDVVVDEGYALLGKLRNRDNRFS